MLLTKSKQLIFQALQAYDVYCNYLSLLLERENSLRRFVKPTDMAVFHVWEPVATRFGSCINQRFRPSVHLWEATYAFIILVTQGPSFEFLDIVNNTPVAQAWHIVGPQSLLAEYMRASIILCVPPSYIFLYSTKNDHGLFSTNEFFILFFVSRRSEMTVKGDWEQGFYPQMQIKKIFSDIFSVYHTSGCYFIFILSH